MQTVRVSRIWVAHLRLRSRPFAGC
jgi:hypothetical protein